MIAKEEKKVEPKEEKIITMTENRWRWWIVIISLLMFGMGRIITLFEFGILRL